MCLAIPAQVKSIEGQQAEVEVGGLRRRVSLVLAPDAAIGDYVLLHTGYAISIIDQAEAEETLRLLEQLADQNEEETAPQT